jgi:antitoxin component of MazEF toxin-antitoxin module
MTVTVEKVGGSLAVIIPSSVVRESNLIEGMTSTSLPGPIL